MKQRKIGGKSVGEIGLGCMGMSYAYGPAVDSESIEVLNRALDIGVNFWDTADMYGAGKNEELLALVLKTRRDEVFLATKFANVYDKTLTTHQDQVEAGVPWIVDNTTPYIRASVDRSLQRLGVDHIDLYYMHRVDHTVPIEETVGTMAELVKAGKVKAIGLSEVNGETLKKAHGTFPITAVQNEFSLWTRDYELNVLPLCEKLGITFVPYSPLGRGFLTGQIKTIDDLPADDWRRQNPRFQGDNFQKNLDIVAKVEEIAKAHNASPGQIALAWVLAFGEHVIPIPGTKRLKYLEENTAASEITLTNTQFQELSAIAPAAGERYPEAAMKMVAR